MLVLNSERPDWRFLRIHESSPSYRGTPSKLKQECAGYLPTQFFPGVVLDTPHRGFGCEELEAQTFDDYTFDVFITQDVMEHVLPRPLSAEKPTERRGQGLHSHDADLQNHDAEHLLRRTACRPLSASRKRALHGWW